MAGPTAAARNDPWNASWAGCATRPVPERKKGGPVTAHPQRAGGHQTRQAPISYIGHHDANLSPVANPATPDVYTRARSGGKYGSAQSIGPLTKRSRSRVSTVHQASSKYL